MNQILLAIFWYSDILLWMKSQFQKYSEGHFQILH